MTLRVDSWCVVAFNVDPYSDCVTTVVLNSLQFSSQGTILRFIFAVTEVIAVVDPGLVDAVEEDFLTVVEEFLA